MICDTQPLEPNYIRFFFFFLPEKIRRLSEIKDQLTLIPSLHRHWLNWLTSQLMTVCQGLRRYQSISSNKPAVHQSRHMLLLLWVSASLSQAPKEFELAKKGIRLYTKKVNLIYLLSQTNPKIIKNLPLKLYLWNETAMLLKK